MTGNNASNKEEFLTALTKCGFDINRLSRLTEAVFSTENNYTIVTITEEGEIAVFSKTEQESPEEVCTPSIAVFEPPKTAIGYSRALQETMEVIEPGTT